MDEISEQIHYYPPASASDMRQAINLPPIIIDLTSVTGQLETLCRKRLKVKPTEKVQWDIKIDKLLKGADTILRHALTHTNNIDFDAHLAMQALMRKDVAEQARMKGIRGLAIILILLSAGIICLHTLRQISRIVSEREAAAARYRHLNEELEERVSERTADLMHANKALQNTLPEVRCHAQRINQVAMNLLLNAVQSMESKGEIRLGARGVDEGVEILVADTGSGIDPEVLPKIFDPFFTTKPIGKGTGPGLNVAYNIIESHKGCISVDSVKGVGTTFTIRLPLDAAQ